MFTRFDSLDLDSVPIFERSRLFSLAPCGLRTPYCEGLASYVTRLAEAHSVRPSTLIAEVVLPLLTSSGLTLKARPDLATFWSAATHTLNGGSRLASAFVSALEILTLRTDLRCTTFRMWSRVTSARGLLRRTRAWCPQCYEDWRQANRTLYDPLAWALRAVVVCPRHLVHLRTRCPSHSCRRPILPLTSTARVGYCSSCGGWLGAPQGTRVSHTALHATGPASTTHVWVARAIGSLIERTADLPEVVPQHRISQVLHLYASRMAGGKISRLGRQLGIPLPRIWRWYTGEVTPELDSLLQICIRLKVSPLTFLTSENPCRGATLPSLSAPPELQSKRRLRRKRFHSDRVKRALEGALASQEQPPPSMRQVAKQLRYKDSHLYRAFPELCHRIARRRTTYLRMEGEQRRALRAQAIRDAVLALRRQNVYPSIARVTRFLGIRSAFWHPESLTIWRHTVNRIKPNRFDMRRDSQDGRTTAG